MTLDVPPSIPIDMFSFLSQMTIKVPLSEMFKIEEHKNRALAWIKGVGKKSDMVSKNLIDEKSFLHQSPKNMRV